MTDHAPQNDPSPLTPDSSAHVTIAGKFFRYHDDDCVVRGRLEGSRYWLIEDISDGAVTLETTRELATYYFYPTLQAMRKEEDGDDDDETGEDQEAVAGPSAASVSSPSGTGTLFSEPGSIPRRRGFWSRFFE